MSSTCYVLRDRHTNVEQIGSLAGAQATFTSVEEKSVQFFDTFDWRLYHAGLSLIQTGRAVCLHRISDWEILSVLQIRGRIDGRFWWDLPEGPLREALKDVLLIRALLPRAHGRWEVQQISILNEDEKTVLRVLLMRIHLANVQEPLTLLRVECVRGYDGAFADFCSRFKKSGMGRPVVHGFDSLLQSMGHKQYSSKPDLVLATDVTGTWAARAILMRLHEIMQQNEEGLREDWDTEFLHDFRVSIRRTRSILSQIVGVLPEDAVLYYQDVFRGLGQASNRLRDLDVYLLEENTYRAMLPLLLEPGLDAMFARLRKERRSAKRELVQYLDTLGYRDLMAKWGNFLKGEQRWHGRAPFADKPAINLARKFIWKRYKKVLKRGVLIGEDTPDEALHRLRIDCKKLRYLLEFFASLFPADTMDHLIGQLKKLQDNLGDFNDLSVQHDELAMYLSKVLPRSRRSDHLLTSAAVGGLITSLYERQQVVRRAFNETFCTFADKPNLYRDLFDQKRV